MRPDAQVNADPQSWAPFPIANLQAVPRYNGQPCAARERPVQEEVRDQEKTFSFRLSRNVTYGSPLGLTSLPPRIAIHFEECSSTQGLFPASQRIHPPSKVTAGGLGLPAQLAEAQPGKGRKT